MSGFEFAKALRAERPTPQPWLVALSGYAQPEDVRRSTASGFDRHVTKPASLETIEDVLAQAEVREQ
jgi:CheY-like chemotaxis protein